MSNRLRLLAKRLVHNVILALEAIAPVAAAIPLLLFNVVVDRLAPTLIDEIRGKVQVLLLTRHAIQFHKRELEFGMAGV